MAKEVKNFFISYWNVLQNHVEKNKEILKMALLLLLTLITGIYINLFTNSNGMANFFGIDLTIFGEIWFMLAFGIIALISLIKASISLFIILIISFGTTFLLYLISRIYIKILKMMGIDSHILILILLMLGEFLIALGILFFNPSRNVIDLNFFITTLSAFLLVWIGLINIRLLDKEIEKRQKANQLGKIYKITKLKNPMNKKISFALLIIFLTLIGIWGSWVLAEKMGKIASPQYVSIIITTAVFLAGFGLIAIDKKESVFYINIKQIISWSLASIVFAFSYIIWQDSQDWSELLFSLSSGFLFFTMTLVLILVLFHDNKYLKEIEKKK